ncbi:hypothetical protein AB0L56_10480 [Streptomyces sp. NPDC052079]|uniref:hypothetical protein n=1 Tax=Streptomyces sp. NPDC052079 TaxID=3155526 RepID=UPI0034280095
MPGLTIVLTDAGPRAIIAVRPGLEAAVRRLFTDKLTAREIATLRSVLRRL